MDGRGVLVLSSMTSVQISPTPLVVGAATRSCLSTRAVVCLGPPPFRDAARLEDRGPTRRRRPVRLHLIGPPQAPKITSHHHNVDLLFTGIINRQCRLVILFRSQKKLLINVFYFILLFQNALCYVLFRYCIHAQSIDSVIHCYWID